jgi:predicted alpha/beta-fold hydrolase
MSWAKGPHAQTILGRYWTRHRLLDTDERCEVALPDGDRLVVFVREKKDSSLPVIYLFHGLGGSTDSDYIPRTASIFHGLGHSIVMANHRGCGPGAGVAAQPYHSGRADDLAAVIAWGRLRFQNRRHIAIGFSLSGNALLLLSGGRKSFPQPDAAIAVNAPLDLAGAAELLDTGLNRLYQWRFVQDIRADVIQRHHLGLIERELDIPSKSSLKQVDDLYTAPFGGFMDRHDYYEQCSSGPHLKKIEIPTIAITAADDPFVDVAAYRRFEHSSQVQLHVERYGGHMGFLSQNVNRFGTRHWLDEALPAAVEKLEGRSS